MKKPPPGKRVPSDAPRRIAAKPRRRTEGDYDYGEMGNTGGSRQARGNKLLSPEANRVQIWRPSWDKNIPTTVRILPTLDPEDTTKIVGYRRSAGHNKFTSWCFGAPSVGFVGIDVKYSFILFHPAWQRSRSYDPASNPYQILFNEFNAAIKSDKARMGKKDVMTKKWYGLAHDSKNPKRRAFSKVQPTNFYRVFMYASGEKYMVDAKTGLPFGAGKRDPTILLSVTKTAAESLQAKLNRKVPGVSDDEKFSKLFEFGDITLLKSGKFVTFLGPAHAESLDFTRYGVPASESESGPDIEEADDDSGSDEGGTEFKHWRTHIHSEFTYVTKAKKRRKITSDISALRDVVIEKHEWWDDVLNFPSHEEICKWLATGFRSMPDILRWGWRDNAEFMTDEVKGILAARTQGPGAEVPTADEDDEEVEEDSELEDDVEDDSELEGEEAEDDEEEEKPRRPKTQRASSVAAEEEEEEGEDAEGEEEEGDEEGEEGEDAEGEEEEDEEVGEVEEVYEEGDDAEEEPPPPPRKKPKHPPAPIPIAKKKKRPAVEDDAESDAYVDDDKEVRELEAMAARARANAKARAQRRNGAPVPTVVVKKKKKKKLRLQ